MIVNPFLLLNSYDSDVFLHRDDNLMPKTRAAWGSRNFVGSTNDKACVTYWLNDVEVFTLNRILHHLKGFSLNCGAKSLCGDCVFNGCTEY